MHDDANPSRAAGHPGRRAFLQRLAAMGIAVRSKQPACEPMGVTTDRERSGIITLFLCGDVMTGRGIDQVLPHPGSPRLHEPYLNSAFSYVELAERASGPIPRPADFPYIWGDSLEALVRAAPDVRIANLETAITTSDTPWPEKGINYRMHPKNLPCLSAARIDCCVLGNNHVLDWGYAGLSETLQVLRDGGIHCAGAGEDSAQAQAPAVLDLGAKGRVLVFGVGTPSSGIPMEWAATSDRAGVDLLPDLSEQTLAPLAARIAAARRARDLVVVSIHWGSNWGYAIPDEHRRFAHGLVERAAVDVVHGHSSHHPRAIEVYRDRLILYGCGDLINDYEGIGGYTAYRPDLTLMYFAQLEAASGRLTHLVMAPMQMRRFRLNRPAPADVQWLGKTVDHEARRFGGRARIRDDGWIELDLQRRGGS